MGEKRNRAAGQAATRGRWGWGRLPGLRKTAGEACGSMKWGAGFAGQAARRRMACRESKLLLAGVRGRGAELDLGGGAAQVDGGDALGLAV